MAVLRVLPLALAAASVAAQSTCGCVGGWQGWRVDCTQTALMQITWRFLNSTACRGIGGACSSINSTCGSAFAFIQAHHDYCGGDDVPTQLERVLHDFENNCTSCLVNKKFKPSLPLCPAVNCTNVAAGNAAAARMATNNCQSSCSSAQCGADYRIIRAYHDGCPDNVADAFEEFIHDLEGPCEAQGCNLATASSYDPNQCGAVRRTSGAATQSIAASVTAVSIVAMLAAQL